jgi:hypothetical protein
LLFISLIGSFQTLVSIFLVRNHVVFYSSLGGPWIFIAFHICVHSFCLCYLWFLQLIIREDLTSIDLFQ